MEQAWKVKVWGVRGSFPTPSPDFLEYGGNTSCISLERGDHLVVLDAGSGFIGLGNHLPPESPKRMDILFSHLHMDHCLGFFGCRLVHDPEMEIHLYGAAQEGRSFEQNLNALVRAPYWPIGLEDFPASIRIHEISPGDCFVLKGADGDSEDIKVRTLQGNHPNQSLLYRLEAGGESIVYGLDCELTEEIRPSLREFSRNCGLLIWDACFTQEDLAKHRGWGHSSWEQGISLGREAGAGTVLMTHYSSQYTDALLQAQEELAARSDSLCRFAREGMEIRLPQARDTCPSS